MANGKKIVIERCPCPSLLLLYSQSPFASVCSLNLTDHPHPASTDKSRPQLPVTASSPRRRLYLKYSPASRPGAASGHHSPHLAPPLATTTGADGHIGAQSKLSEPRLPRQSIARPLWLPVRAETNLLRQKDARLAADPLRRSPRTIKTGGQER